MGEKMGRKTEKFSSVCMKEREKETKLDRWINRDSDREIDR